MKTAKEAREIASGIVVTSLEEDLKDINLKIETAANNGFFKLMITKPVLDNKLIEKLKSLGYEVEIKYSIPYCALISW